MGLEGGRLRLCLRSHLAVRLPNALSNRGYVQGLQNPGGQKLNAPIELIRH